MTAMTSGRDLRQVREATVRHHCEAENRHDLDALLATFSSSRASYDIPAFGEAGQPADAAGVRAIDRRTFRRVEAGLRLVLGL